MPTAPAPPTVTAVVLARNRAPALRIVLEQLDRQPVDEVLVADNGSEDETAELVDGWGGKVRRIDLGDNVGIAARNVAARQASGELLLMLEDDCHPVDDAVEVLAEAFRADASLGVAGGFVVDVDAEDNVLRSTEPGTFDWFLRGSRPPGPDGLPAFWFPEGASMLRRDAFLACGGFYEPYFFTLSELDLATRMLSAGWEVRYVPRARFHHNKASAGRAPGRTLELMVRNHLWYFWRHFPLRRALLRAPAYLAFELMLCTANGHPGAWVRGIASAWRDRAAVRGARRPLTREVLRRAELDRGRLHVKLLVAQFARRLRRLTGSG